MSFVRFCFERAFTKWEAGVMKLQSDGDGAGGVSERIEPRNVFPCFLSH